ncbi:multifunctional beta-oxidation protein [Pseudozyma hubeiensis SY62]|uniref:Multifunctional beta-oxidation protein n=1 Tax=Pseudozyma hubeiensis (strain SY62) TaxID=1305764 RepID=R9P131_PSEHS|nr:multifunctional beta-oxidation protein [Pseudozyma hubeiensis SY62]GAC94978.1 multifunctional beta-oxidation protein [Pseudozyma hubeiensis SY62]
MMKPRLTTIDDNGDDDDGEVKIYRQSKLLCSESISPRSGCAWRYDSQTAVLLVRTADLPIADAYFFGCFGPSVCLQLASHKSAKPSDDAVAVAFLSSYHPEHLHPTSLPLSLSHNKEGLARVLLVLRIVKQIATSLLRTLHARHSWTRLSVATVNRPLSIRPPARIASSPSTDTTQV